MSQDIAYCNALVNSVKTHIRPLVDALLEKADFMLLADYQSYIECQEKVSQAFQDSDRWTRMSIFNVARMGKFSCERAIREYCQDIWKVQPVHIES